jgi:hypothetical protein
MQMIHRSKHSTGRRPAGLHTWERLLDGAANGGGGPAGDEGRWRAGGHVRLRVPRLGGVLGPEHARPVTIVEGGHAAAPLALPNSPFDRWPICSCPLCGNDHQICLCVLRIMAR